MAVAAAAHCLTTPPPTGPAFDAGDLVQHIRDAIDEPIPSPASPFFQFELTDKAAAHNWTILKDTYATVDAKSKNSPRASPIKYECSTLVRTFGDV